MYERVKELCRSRGITITDLEKNLGFGTRTIYNRSNHAPSVDKVIAVAEYFGVSLDFLIFGKTEEKKIGAGSIIDAVDGLSPEALEATLQLIEALKK